MEKHYRLLYPMKVVLVASGHCGKDNVMTVAWCFPLSANPPLFGVSISRKRFSYHLIGASREFVINIPGPELMEAVRICGENTGADKDKFELAKITKMKSVRVSAPSIAECHTSIECRVLATRSVSQNKYAYFTRDKPCWDAGNGILETGDHVLFVGEAVNFRVTGKENKCIVQTKEGGLKIL